MAQLVKQSTLDFGSGHHLAVCKIKPHIGLCADSKEPAWYALSPSLFATPFLSAPPLLMLSLFLKNKQTLKTSVYIILVYILQITKYILDFN